MFLLSPDVLQVMLQSQECATRSGAAPSTMKTASPQPSLWHTRPDMCRFLFMFVLLHLCRCFKLLTKTVLFPRSHCVTVRGKSLSFSLIPQLHMLSVITFLGLFPHDLYVRRHSGPLSRLAVRTLAVNMFAFSRWFIEHTSKNTST